MMEVRYIYLTNNDIFISHRIDGYTILTPLFSIKCSDLEKFTVKMIQASFVISSNKHFLAIFTSENSIHDHKISKAS